MQIPFSLIFFCALFLFWISPFTLIAKSIPIVFKPNWKKYRIEISSKVKLKPNEQINYRTYWKSWVREQTISKASIPLENFLINNQTRVKDLLQTNASFARKYAVFLESLEPQYFSVKKNYAFTDILIKMRGKGSFLEILPIPWGSFHYKDLEPSQYVGEAYQIKEAKGTFSQSLAPIIYSGLILDVRNYGFQPSLSPRIYSQGGQLIYGAEYIHSKLGVERGIADFSKTIDSKEVKKRTGEKPLYIVALGVSGKYRTNAVISYQNQKIFFDHEKSILSLLKCRVAFITD